jgi:hypothetical protein
MRHGAILGNLATGWEREFVKWPALQIAAVIFVRYIQDNPTKARLSAQHWGFVRPYDNWPFHKR